MNVNDIKEILGAEIICRTDLLETPVVAACGSDMMSDVLAFVKEQAVLLSPCFKCIADDAPSSLTLGPQRLPYCLTHVWFLLNEWMIFETIQVNPVI